MHPADCPSNWEYEDHAGWDVTLARLAAEILITLRRGTLDILSVSCDSRPVHFKLFESLTPRDCSYFAGHYRGENYRCLRFYNVRIPTDPRVGWPCDGLPLVMGRIADSVLRSIKSLDEGHKAPESQLPPEQKLIFVVACACRLFELFLRIHPYANGNGHAARFLVWSILGRYGYWPRRWPLHPRPEEPYVDLIERYRNGEREALETYMIQNILGN
jgi:hypothetical protein